MSRGLCFWLIWFFPLFGAHWLPVNFSSSILYNINRSKLCYNIKWYSVDNSFLEWPNHSIYIIYSIFWRISVWHVFRFSLFVMLLFPSFIIFFLLSFVLNSLCRHTKHNVYIKLLARVTFLNFCYIITINEPNW